MKLLLDFNEALNQVKVKLEGGGTLFIDRLKSEHKEALTYELVNLILEHLPDTLEFTTFENPHLIKVLEESNVTFEKESNKLIFKH